MWIRRCLSKCDPTLKAFPHSLHWNGFSPVWIRWCRSRCEVQLKLFPHSSHLYGLSLVWPFWCAARASASENLLSHWSHLWDLFSRCSLWCRRRLDFWLKLLPHSTHWWFLLCAGGFLRDIWGLEATMVCGRGLSCCCFPSVREAFSPVPDGGFSASIGFLSRTFAFCRFVLLGITSRGTGSCLSLNSSPEEINIAEAT